MKFFTKNMLAWAGYSLLLYLLFSFIIETENPLKHTAIFFTIQLAAFCMNTKLLFPFLLDVKKYLLFILSNLVLIILAAFINTLLEEGAEEIFGGGYDIFETLMAHSVPAFIGVFVALILHNYHQELKREEKEKKRILAEKNFLIQQINPHFLFNTLNNIYSLTIDNNPKGPEAILQLSKMLDYSLYGNKDEYVSLRSEVTYITNFIDLFKLKDDRIHRISFTHDQVDERSSIAPMLLLPFVENAFKHGNIEDVDKGYVDIEVSSNESEINFSCVSSFVEGKTVDKVGGIGIKNVTRRLMLLYPQKHSLQITNENQVYKVSLKIQTNGI
ncbi:sensor histidine kinase [Tenacibaculum aiptasiae]|uniref:sensor histidine kinase n=1 Tax=Tenacibaculum aiptasiae TaxID=426481 RepID=UPI003B59FF71